MDRLWNSKLTDDRYTQLPVDRIEYSYWQDDPTKQNTIRLWWDSHDTSDSNNILEPQVKVPTQVMPPFLPTQDPVGAADSALRMPDLSHGARFYTYDLDHKPTYLSNEFVDNDHFISYRQITSQNVKLTYEFFESERMRLGLPYSFSRKICNDARNRESKVQK